MIYLLKGVIARKASDAVIVYVNGVGYGVTVPLSTSSNLGNIGSEVELMIHTIQRENSIELFGFLTDAEKTMFEKLLCVSGIGPRVANNMLSSISPKEFADSVRKGDLAQRKIRGIGSKTAARIVNELQDKLDDLQGDQESEMPDEMLKDTVSALMNLGYTKAELDLFTPEIIKIIKTSESIENVIRDSLRAIRKS